MNLNGVLIEYFLTGSISIIWLFLYSNEPFFQNFDDSDKILIAPVIISITYIVGMVIDLLGKFYTKGFEKLISRYFKNFTIRKYTINCSLAEITAFSPELGKQLEMRSSRDRIARGAIVNAIISMFLFSLYYPKYAGIIIISGLVTVILLSLLWMRYQKLSNKYHNDCQVVIFNKR